MRYRWKGDSMAMDMSGRALDTRFCTPVKGRLRGATEA